MRFIAGAALLLSAALASPSHAAAPPDAVVRGRLVGGRCLFAEHVRIRSGYAARLDAGCALRMEPAGDTPLANEIHPGADFLPKRLGADNSVVVGAGSEAVGQPPSVSGILPAPGYVAKVAFSELWIFDEYNRVMYKDEMDFAFQRRLSDGAMSAVEPAYGSCQTAEVVDVDPNDVPPDLGHTVGNATTTSAPYDPYVLECYSDLRTATSSALVFDSGGWYGTVVGAFNIGSAFDFREMGSHWVGDRAGVNKTLSDCDLGGDLPKPPTGEWTHQCIQRVGDQGDAAARS